MCLFFYQNKIEVSGTYQTFYIVFLYTEFP
jgi:hypothetical protein